LVELLGLLIPCFDETMRPIIFSRKEDAPFEESRRPVMIDGRKENPGGELPTYAKKGGGCAERLCNGTEGWRTKKEMRTLSGRPGKFGITYDRRVH